MTEIEMSGYARSLSTSCDDPWSTPKLCLHDWSQSQIAQSLSRGPIHSSPCCHPWTVWTHYTLCLRSTSATVCRSLKCPCHHPSLCTHCCVRSTGHCLELPLLSLLPPLALHTLVCPLHCRWFTFLRNYLCQYSGLLLVAVFSVQYTFSNVYTGPNIDIHRSGDAGPQCFDNLPQLRLLISSSPIMETDAASGQI